MSELLEFIIIAIIAVNLPWMALTSYRVVFKDEKIIMKHGFFPSNIVEVIFLPYLLYCYLIREK